MGRSAHHSRFARYAVTVVAVRNTLLRRLAYVTTPRVRRARSHTSRRRLTAGCIPASCAFSAGPYSRRLFSSASFILSPPLPPGYRIFCAPYWIMGYTRRHVAHVLRAQNCVTILPFATACAAPTRYLRSGFCRTPASGHNSRLPLPQPHLCQ